MTLLLSILTLVTLGPVPAEASVGSHVAGVGSTVAGTKSAPKAASEVRRDPLVFVSVTHPDDPQSLRRALEDNLRKEGFQVVTITEEERSAGERPSVDLLVLATVSEITVGGPGPRESVRVTAIWTSEGTVAHFEHAVGTAQDPLDLARVSATFAEGLREAIQPEAARR